MLASTCYMLTLFCLPWPIFFSFTRLLGMVVWGFKIFVLPELWDLIPWKIFCCKYLKSSMTQLFVSFYVSVIACILGRDPHGQNHMVVGFTTTCTYMQSVAITTNVVSSNPAHDEVYLIQHYVISLSVTYGRSVDFSGYYDFLSIKPNVMI